MLCIKSIDEMSHTDTCIVIGLFAPLSVSHTIHPFRLQGYFLDLCTYTQLQVLKPLAVFAIHLLAQIIVKE